MSYNHYAPYHADQHSLHTDNHSHQQQSPSRPIDGLAAADPTPAVQKDGAIMLPPPFHSPPSTNAPTQYQNTHGYSAESPQPRPYESSYPLHHYPHPHHPQRPPPSNYYSQSYHSNGYSSSNPPPFSHNEPVYANTGYPPSQPHQYQQQQEQQQPGHRYVQHPHHQFESQPIINQQSYSTAQPSPTVSSHILPSRISDGGIIRDSQQIPYNPANHGQSPPIPNRHLPQPPQLQNVPITNLPSHSTAHPVLPPPIPYGSTTYPDQPQGYPDRHSSYHHQIPSPEQQREQYQQQQQQYHQLHLPPPPPLASNHPREFVNIAPAKSTKKRNHATNGAPSKSRNFEMVDAQAVDQSRLGPKKRGRPAKLSKKQVIGILERAVANGISWSDHRLPSEDDHSMISADGAPEILVRGPKKKSRLDAIKSTSFEEISSDLSFNRGESTSSIIGSVDEKNSPTVSYIDLRDIPDTPIVVPVHSGSKRVAIGEDLDPVILSVAQPLQLLRPVTGAALAFIPATVVEITSSEVKDDSVLASNESLDEGKISETIVSNDSVEHEPLNETSAARANDTTSEPHDIEMKNEDGASNGGKAESSAEDDSSAVSINPNQVILDQALLECQRRRLSLPEALDALSVVDFVREFGSDLLGLDDVDTITLGTFEKMIYQPQTHFSKLLSIYKALLCRIYPKARFSATTELADVPGHLSHHFACSNSAAINTGSFRIDARYLCKIFGQVEFLNIPPPFHAAAFCSLVASIHASKSFHERLLAAFEETEQLRRERNGLQQRMREARLQLKSAEGDLVSMDAITREMEQSIVDTKHFLETGLLRGDSIPKQISPEDRVINTTAIADLEEKVKQRAIERAVVAARYTQLETDLAAHEAQDAALKVTWEKKCFRVRPAVGRTLGYDREGSQYLWIDVGSSDVVSFKPTDEADVSIEGQKEAMDHGEETESEKEVVLLEKPDRTPFHIGGILVDSSALVNQSTFEKEAHSYTFIDTIPLIKSFGKSLNDRGFRERELLISLRECFESKGLTLPNPAATSNLRKAWEQLDLVPAGPAERVLQKGLQGFAAWIESLGQPLSSSNVPAETGEDTNSGSRENVGSSDRPTRARRLRSAPSSSAVPTSDVPPASLETLSTPAITFTDSCVSLSKSLLRDLAPLQGTKPLVPASKREQNNIESCKTLTEAIELGSLFISRKFGKETVAELEERIERCETWSMLCVLIGDVIRETKARNLNVWIADTQDGGWVEEEEDPSDANDYAKWHVHEKKKAAKRPKKAAKYDDDEDD
ncbi:hypothetical protein HDU78_002062 [Chytriomyces hyalinus]|nr:hypothetical protein HDU78_002062 [Chytriomyces hyalinus]